MCGICGYWVHENGSAHGDGVLQNMLRTIEHRGPDGSGYNIIPGGGPALGHARLSVIDVSQAGSQPMTSKSGRYTIVYNGEIYNHLEIRAELEQTGQIRWAGHSDTETILAGCDLWGLDKTLEIIIGMFAFAIWDNKNKTLSMARDRLGEKPIYYGAFDGFFLFGSELSVFRDYPDFAAKIDVDSVTALIQRSYVPGPYSIYENVVKLQPGQVATVNYNPGSSVPVVKTNFYWSLKDQFDKGAKAPSVGSKSNSIAALDSIITKVVESQMISDVPLGAFLSGGIDSSLITAVMQKISSEPVKTFSIGFDDKQFDESASARSIAKYLGTDHHELIVTPEHIMGVIPKLSNIYSEPFADSSQLPTFLVSELARKHVTVALTGDGADELFGGYNRYVAAGRIWAGASSVPLLIRRIIGNTLLAVPKSSWDRFFNILSFFSANKISARLPGEKIHKTGRLLKRENKSDYFESLISMTDDAESFVNGGKVCKTILNDHCSQPNVGTMEEWMMSMDALTYLPDDICVKVDRASMANSLETRAPFLDRRVVDFATKLPLNFKVRDNESKWILREVLSAYVPRDFFDRPKMGFGIPFGKWLRGPLFHWADELLSVERLSSSGFFDVEKVRSVWRAHNRGNGTHEYLLWNIIVFNSWLEEWGER